MTAPLIVKCPEHLEAVRKFADETNQRQQLEEKLTSLTRYLPDGWRVELYTDFAPYSFIWVEIRIEDNYRGMLGGLIYHGQIPNHGGGYPTFSVCLTPTSGWSIHT
jgi:hypothetical protein